MVTMNRSEKDQVQQSIPLDHLGDRFLKAWMEANGVTDCQAKVLTGEGGLAIIIEGAFTQAERLLAERRPAENPLRHYVNALMNVILEDEIPSLTREVGQKIMSFGNDINFEKGWVMWYVKLEEPRT
jgi:uncharacterized protein YbcI